MDTLDSAQQLDHGRPGREFFVNALHLLTLVALAVAQPLLDLLSRFPQFLIAHGSRPVDLVLMVLGLCLLLPSLLILLDAIVARLYPPGYGGFHALLVFLLVTALSLQGLKRLALSAWTLSLAAPAIACVFTVAYSRLRAFRTFLSVLSPSVILVPALFLTHDPIARILNPPGNEKTEHPTIRSQVPVVMVVFDELPLVSLLDERERIDPVRYPHFAALAQQAYWFRNATTVSEGTLISVPAILDGLYPTPQRPRLPILGDHPHNLFTLLGSSYKLHIEENGTRLSPLPSSRDPQVRLLAEDLMIVYLHLLLHEDIASRFLPPVGASWTGFRGEGQPATETDPSTATSGPTWNDFKVDWSGRHQRFREFVRSITAGTAQLLFLHSTLPHASWKYLPSGKQYTLHEPPGVRGVIGPNNRGIEVNRWLEDEWAVEQSYQRHLLQVGFVDKLLGDLVARLKELEIYDKALLVVTSDHGGSFRANDSRRRVTSTNFADIMCIPLLIKAPGQRAGIVSDRNVETVDILPTVADLLGVPLPWPVDGQSALDPSAPERSAKTIFSDRGEKFLFADTARARLEAVQRKFSLFGSGSWERVFHIGDFPTLLGTPVSRLSVGRRSRLTVRLRGLRFFQQVNLEAPFLLCDITGRVTGDSATSGSHTLAVAVNGVVRGVTRTARFREDWGFEALVPDTSFHDGSNRVVVYEIEKRDGTQVLRPTGSTALPVFQWVESPSGANLRDEKGSRIPVRKGEMTGWVVSRMEDNRVKIGGWAIDEEALSLPRFVVLFKDGHFLQAQATHEERPEVVARYGNSGLLRSGFLFELPLGDFPDPTRTEVRVFAVSDRNLAGELHYPLPSDAGNWHFRPRAQAPTTAEPSFNALQGNRYLWGKAIRFGRGENGGRYQEEGWSRPQEGMTWATGPRATLAFHLPPVKGPLLLQVRAYPFLPPGRSRGQRVQVLVNGRNVGQWILDEPSFREHRLQVGKEAWLNSRINRVTFEFPDAVAPADVGVGPDKRRLGLAFMSLTLEPAD